MVHYNLIAMLFNSTTRIFAFLSMEEVILDGGLLGPSGLETRGFCVFFLAIVHVHG
jgi:hypothetical protein